MKKLKLFSLLMLLFVGLTSMWGAEGDTHDFAQTLQQNLNNGVAIPSITINAQAYPVKKVSVTCRYNKTAGGFTVSVTVGGKAFGTSKTLNENTTTTFDFEGDAAIGQVVVSFTNNCTGSTGQGTCWCSNVQLTEGASSGSSKCSTPSISPDACSFYGSKEVTITCATASASIYYTIDNSAPSSTNGTLYEGSFMVSDATTTVKAIAVKDGLDDSDVASVTYTYAGPAITSYEIDFESALEAYVNWEFTNAEVGTNGDNTNISAHAGTHYGTTGGKSTAAIKTKEKIATPGTFTCYVSKQTDNTTASTWYIQVSSNGSAWTNVKSQDAKSMAKGNWVKFSADLSSYSNVYVRLYYDGGTAVRNVDDISLAMAQASVSADPTSIAFGTVKKGASKSAEEFAIEGIRLDDSEDVTATSSNTSVFTCAVKEGDSLTPEDGEVVASIVVTPNTNATVGEYSEKITIAGGGLSVDSIITVDVTMTIAYEVALAVNDNEKGSATINGGTATIFNLGAANSISLVATKASDDYQFDGWTVSPENAVTFADASLSTTTATANANATITANFKTKSCSNLAAPASSSVEKTHCGATISWAAVTNASSYLVNITKHEGSVAVVTNAIVNTNSYTKESGLEAKTQYDYSIMALGDGTEYCVEGNGELENNFTTTDYPAATVTLSENGVESTLSGSHKLNEEIDLPTSVTTSMTGKVLKGWSTIAIANAVNSEPVSNYYAAGAKYTIASTADKLYAVYANKEGEDGAAANTILWFEDFEGYGEDLNPDAPSDGKVYGDAEVAYTYSNGTGSSTTKIYASGGPITTEGKASNLLVAKSDGYFKISGIPTGNAEELSLEYRKGGSGTVAISTPTDGVSYSDGSFTFTKEVSKFDLVISNSNSSSNYRIDSIVVKVKTAKTATYSAYTTNSYVVTYTASVEHGTIAIKLGNATIGSGNKVGSGVTLTVVANPESGYHLSALSAGGESIIDTKEFTIGASDVEVEAEFSIGTALENVETSVKAVKVLRDGQIFILRGDKTFNAQGQLVK